MSYLKLGIAVVLVMSLLAACWKVNSWREQSAELDTVQERYASYRQSMTNQIAELARQEKVNDEISAGYVAIIQHQSATLDDARKRLAGVSLRVGTCPAVPAASGPTEAAVGAPPASADRQSGMVDATSVAERFAACDKTGARLNALNAWVDALPSVCAAEVQGQ